MPGAAFRVSKGTNCTEGKTGSSAGGSYAMTCYLRHMGWMFRVLELENDAGNRHRLDRAIKRALGLAQDAPCSEVEAFLEALSGEERFELIDALEQDLAG